MPIKCFKIRLKTDILQRFQTSAIDCRISSYAGLQCEVIDGYSKGAGYRPGMRLQGNAFRNQWTAVWVDEAWRFVNCNWGARHVTGSVGGADRLTYKCDEFYFLTDPAEHIYQHFPDNEKWQASYELHQFVMLAKTKQMHSSGTV